MIRLVETTNINNDSEKGRLKAYMVYANDVYLGEVQQAHKDTLDVRSPVIWQAGDFDFETRKDAVEFLANRKR